MKIRRLSAAIAAVASGALLFSACSSPLGGDDGDTAPTSNGSAEADGPCKADLGEVTTADGEIKVANEQEYSGYNSYTDATYTSYNTMTTGQMLPGFWYYGVDGTICTNEEFGSYEMVSEEPLVAKYTINDAAVWSDGEPVSYADVLLHWATQAITADGTVTEDGSEKPLFTYVGGLELGTYTPDGPQADSWDAKEMTLEFAKTHADWDLQISTLLPAHIVAEQAGVSTEELVAAIQDVDMDVLEPAAEFWNEGWLFDKPGELPDLALVPSAGPYMFQEGGWTAGQSITLTANENYWGTPPATKQLTFRQIAADAQIQALQNGDLDAINPNGPTVDTITQLEALGDAVNLQTAQNFTWEHLDLNFASGPFADDEGGLAAREAFALCVPRQKIVDDLVKPVDESAVVMNAREYFPFQEEYEQVTAGSYDGRYDEVNLDEAKAKFAESGLDEGTEIRIGYQDPNPRRTDTVAAIKASCDQVGFEIVDGGSGVFFDEVLPEGDFEVALFAWQGSGTVTSGSSIYQSTGGQMQTGYSNATVDEAWDNVLGTTDEAVQLENKIVIEKELWDTLFNIPLYAHPNVYASNSAISNVRITAAQGGILWNGEQWSLAE